MALSVLDLELRECGRIFLPSSSIKFLEAPKKVLSSFCWGCGYFWATPFFSVSGDVQRDKCVYLCTYLTDLYDFLAFRTGLDMINRYILFDDLEG